MSIENNSHLSAHPQNWRIDASANPSFGILLAHGAGAGMDNAFMAAMAERLSALGVLVVRFEFDYMRIARQTQKRRPPEAMAKLVQCFARHYQAVVAEYSTIDWLIGGKSMGGRVAALSQPELNSLGVVCLGYPFHPPKKPESLRLEPLQALVTPALVIQGSRDSLGNREEVEGYQREFGVPGNVSIRWLEDGDHDLKPRKRSGFNHDQHLDTAARWLVAFGEDQRLL